jgi:hypothetical protein
MIAMKRQATISDPASRIWQRVLEFRGEVSPGAARALLQLQFSEHDHTQMAELSAKARSGFLSATEQTDFDTFERLGCLLDIVHSKARLILKKKPKRAS